VTREGNPAVDLFRKTVVFLVALAIACAIIKGAWFITGMGTWTGLGPLPWPAALFMLAFFRVRYRPVRD
jgi:hypothetical protein